MPELVKVTAGDALLPGQIAILEDHPDHPVQSMGKKGEPDYTEFHQALIVKDDPKFHSGEVAMTTLVAQKLQLGDLKYGTAKIAGGLPVDPELDGGQDATAEANKKAIEKAQNEETMADKNTEQAIKAEAEKAKK